MTRDTHVTLGGVSTSRSCKQGERAHDPSGEPLFDPRPRWVNEEYIVILLYGFFGWLKSLVVFIYTEVCMYIYVCIYIYV